MMTKLHAKFNAKILPVVTRWARANFRDPDLVAECIGLAWKWTRSLHRRRKDGSKFPSAIAGFAVRAVRSGRRVAGQLPSKDAMSPRAWWRHAFTVQRLPDIETESCNPMMEALADHGRADHAAFLIDWPRFLGEQSERDRQLAELLGMGEQAAKVAHKLKLSPGRVTQLRHRLRDRWQEFHWKE